MELRGAVVVVTGASAGIGWATAAAFASAGSTVVATARRKGRLDGLVEAIERRGGRALAVSCDVRDRGQVDAVRDRVLREYGRCDVLVNNAGIPGGGAFDALTIEQVDSIVATNFLGVVYGTKAFLQAMLEAGRGHVVNVASLAGRYAVPGSAVYSATKHAVVAFSEALYLELRPRGVIVTVVNPALVATEAFPHRDAIARGRSVMRPERIARAIGDVVRRGT